jgi:hypothetical protein
MTLTTYYKDKMWIIRGTVVLAVLVTTLLCAVLGFAQKPEYDFYPEFRNSFTPKLRAENPSVADERSDRGKVRREAQERRSR